MTVGMALTVVGCSHDAPPEGAAVKNRDQLPVMVSHGVSQLISDSGITHYKIITEEWAVYDKTEPPRQEFKKGILILRYDDKMNIDMHITADTAYWYNQDLWELRGRVHLDNEASKMTFHSEQLFWDMKKKEFYSNAWMKVVTPEREVEGSRFRANEQMTKYEVYDDKGRVPMPTKKDNNTAQNGTNTAQNDTAAATTKAK